MFNNKFLKQLSKPHVVALSTAGLLMGTGVLLNDSISSESARTEVSLAVSGTASTGLREVVLLADENTRNAPTVSPFMAGEVNEPTDKTVESEMGLVQVAMAQTPLQGITAQSTAEPLVPTLSSANILNDDQNVLEERAPGAEENLASDSLDWKRFTVSSGDTLSGLFSKAGFNDALLYSINAQVKDKSWARIYPGERIAFGVNGDGNLAALDIERSQLETWTIVRSDDDRYALSKTLRETDKKTAVAEGTIKSIFFNAAQNAGLTGSQTMALAGLFSWDVDFALDIREGDSFKVIYEDLYLDGKKIGTGDILAAEFTNQGRTHKAVRFTHKDGRVSYYDENGNSLKKAFLRSPIDFARISSHFSLNRKHPVLHRFRAHKGTDYAAGRGTPIKSTGDGKVIFAGVKGGYGNVIILQHGQGITTLYGHMNAFARGMRSGSRVKQGQVIGYVGSTGLASGPHCHYEFRVHGVHKNPVTVALPKADPVPSSERAAFKKQAQSVLAKLGTGPDDIQLAMESSKSATRL